jgi:hypothetical protein
MVGSVCPTGDSLADGFAGSDGNFNRASNDLIGDLSNAPFSANEHWAAERLSNVATPGAGHCEHDIFLHCPYPIQSDAVL